MKKIGLATEKDRFKKNRKKPLSKLIKKTPLDTSFAELAARERARGNCWVQEVHIALAYNNATSSECLLKEAIRFQDDARTLQLLENNPNLAHQSSNFSPLPEAACYKNMTLVKILVEQFNVDINIENGENETALHKACYNLDLEMAIYLLEHKANVNVQFASIFGSPLQTALSRIINRNPEGINKHVALIELLVSYGADVNLVNRFYNQTPREYITSRCKDPILAEKFLAALDVTPGVHQLCSQLNSILEDAKPDPVDVLIEELPSLSFRSPEENPNIIASASQENNSTNCYRSLSSPP